MALQCEQQEGDMRMISVVIPYSKDKTYLKRCLSMIKRQSCKDIEIILIADNCPPGLSEEYSLRFICCESEANKYYALNQALDTAKGDYIFFSGIASVCAENTLEELRKAADGNKESFPYISCYCEQKGELSEHGAALASLYGKLFETAVIKKHNIRFNEASMLAETEFVYIYMGLYSSIQLLDRLEIYETGKPLADMEDAAITVQEWRNVLSQVRLLKASIKSPALDSLCRMVEKCRISSYELLAVTEEELHEAYELNYCIAKPVLKEWWPRIMDNGDEELFIKVQRYFALFEQDEDFLSLLMHTCDLTKEHYCYIKDNEVNKALFFLKETSGNMDQQAALEKMLLPLKEEIETLRVSMDAIEENRNRNENPNGFELAQFTVDGYSKGKLGLQTIYKSFRAWLKYKFK